MDPDNIWTVDMNNIYAVGFSLGLRRGLRLISWYKNELELHCDAFIPSITAIPTTGVLDRQVLSTWNSPTA
jgi:hypothetical protein